MTTRSLTCALLLALSTYSCDAVPSKTSGSETLAPLVIQGIEPGMSRDEVQSKMGEPLVEEKRAGFISTELAYETIVVGIDEFGAVVMIESKTADACILTSVCPKAPLGQMQAELDEAGYLFAVIEDTLIVNGDGCWGEVPIVNGRAQSVVIRCSP